MNTFRSTCAALLAAAGCAGAVGAQPVERGTLLVASEQITGVTFSESVVLLIHHDANGSLGLVINRPTRLEPTRVFPALENLEEYARPVYYGGPVTPMRPLMLLRDPPAALTRDATGMTVLGDMFVTDNPGSLTHGAPVADDRLRIYAGHAAWEPGQLDQEIADGDWDVLRGRTEVVFSNEPLELWGQLRTAGPQPELVVEQLRRQPPPDASAGATGSASRSALR